MRKCLWTKKVLFAMTAGLVCSGYAAASGWEEIWENLSRGRTIQPGISQSAALYGAYTDFTVYDGDSVPNNFGDTDRIDMVIRSATSDDKLSFSGTKEQLGEWAKNNSGTLLKIIFPSSPEASFGGITSGQLTTQQLMLASYGTLSAVRNMDIQVSGQYDFFELGPEKTKATGSSGMLASGWDFGEGIHNFGFIIPYRYITSDDELESKMGYFSFIPAYKYRYNIGKSRLEWLINLSVGAVYLESGLFPDGGGYAEYGGGTGVSVSEQISENLTSKIGCHYQIVKRDIPDSLVPDELKWVSKALNDLDPEQDLTVFAGFSYDIIPKIWDISSNLYRIHQLQSDVESDFRNQTVWNIYTGYTYKFFHMQVGYKTSFEIEDYKDNSIIASLRFSW